LKSRGAQTDAAAAGAAASGARRTVSAPKAASDLVAVDRRLVRQARVSAS